MFNGNKKIKESDLGYKGKKWQTGSGDKSLINQVRISGKSSLVGREYSREKYVKFSNPKHPNNAPSWDQTAQMGSLTVYSSSLNM